MEQNQSFEYTYCAAQQQEIEAIRKKYLPKEEDKLARLRRLHDSSTQKAQTVSIAAGVLGALVLGTGMSLCMTDLGAALGQWAMMLGILVGILGLVMITLAYPLFHTVLRKERHRLAPEILKLTEELLK